MNVLVTISIIIILTFLQKYFYKMLYFIKNKTQTKIRKIIDFFIRFWIIIHEICHLFFWFFSWAKILEISLFKKDWWMVKYETKNYIWAMPYNYQKNLFFIKLFLNQFGIFFTSIGPLLFGIFFNFLFLKFTLWIEDIEYFIENPFSINWNIYNFLFTFIYLFLVPSFVLSFTDLSNFVISRQDTKSATIIWSIINSLIFTIFLFILSFFVDYLILFLGCFIITFWITFVIYLVFLIYSKMKKPL